MSALRRSSVVWVVLTSCGCTELLGADFEETSVGHRVVVSRPPHPGDDSGAEPPLTGTGTVTSSDGRIECGSQCIVDTKSLLTLTATAEAGSAFAGWRTDPITDCDRTREATCVLNIEQAVSVDAFFVTNGANVWGTLISSPADDTARGIAVGMGGDTYATGCMRAPFSVGGTDWETLGECDALVLALDPRGNARQSRLIRSESNDQAFDIAFDGQGPVIAGMIEGLSGKGVWVDVLGEQSNSGWDGFVAAFDADLNLRWRWWTPHDSITAYSGIVSNGIDRIYAAGRLWGTVDTQTATFVSDEEDVVLVALDTDGTELWTAQLGGPGHQILMDLAIASNGDVVVGGGPGGGIELNARGGACSVSPKDPFLARFDAAGACVTARSIAEGIGGAELREIAVDTDGDVVVSGIFSGVADFSRGTDPEMVLDAGQEIELFVVRLGPDLGWMPGKSWALQIGGNVKSSALTAAHGSVLVGLDAHADVSLGTRLLPIDTRRVVLARFDAAGAPVWARSYGPAAEGAVHDLAWDDVSGTWLMAAELVDTQPPVSFDFGNVSQSATVLYAADAVIARFAP